MQRIVLCRVTERVLSSVMVPLLIVGLPAPFAQEWIDNRLIVGR